jgi:hypothetical protein
MTASPRILPQGVVRKVLEFLTRGKSGNASAPQSQFGDVVAPRCSPATIIRPDSEETAREPLGKRQRELVSALNEKDSRLADMYLGVLWVRSHPSNPDGVAHAAHGMRELMEKLPIYLNFPLRQSNVSLTEKVNELESAWSKGCDSSCLKTGWSGNIDAPLRKFLDSVASFFDWYVVSRPKRKERTAKVLRSLDLAGVALPEAVERIQIDEWHDMHGYFQGVAHHNNGAPTREFENYLQGFEVFILDRLRPKIFDDQAKLQNLIEEAEGGA